MKLTTISDLQTVSKEELKNAISLTQIIPRIERYLDDQNLEPHSKRLGVFSASDLGSRGGTSLCGKYPMGCARILYYRYIGEEPESRIQPRTRRIFNTGSKIHEQLQGYLSKLADESGDSEAFFEEVKFCPENNRTADIYEIESTTDGELVLELKADSIRVGLEIKSINKEGFKKLSRPYPEVIVQSHVYMKCLDLPLIIILYYCKDDSTMVEYPIVYNADVWDAIAAKIDYVRDLAVDEHLPDREPGFHCRDCRYAYICKPAKRINRKVWSAS